MWQISLLRGEEPWQKSVKTFDAAGKKLSDFKAGKYFCHKKVEVASLAELRKCFLRHPQWFRIYGDVSAPEITERNSDFVTEDGVDIFMLDIDGWDTPEFNYNIKSSIEKAIVRALEDRQLGFLTRYSFLALWSQSAWPGKKGLRCHLYWLLDGRISLERLRAYAHAKNDIIGGEKAAIDWKSWRAVQPDYTGQRVIEGGDDPIPVARRAFVIQREAGEVLPLSELEEEISGVDLMTGLVNSPQKIETGKTWQETLGLCGGPHGINEYAYRAAAQYVQENGTPDNLKAVAREMHDLAWEAVEKTSRGSENDRATYDVARFEQYLKSACDRGYGSEADAVLAEVEAACAGKDVKKLLSKDMLQKLKKLAKKHPSKWFEATSLVKTGLKGVLAVGDFKRAVTLAEVGPEEAEKFLDGRDLMDAVLDKFNWIIDQHGMRYLELKNPENGRTKLFTFDELKDTFYNIAKNLNPGVSAQIGKDCLSYILGSDHPLDEDTGRWKKRTVGAQHVNLGEEIYWNLGDNNGSWEVLKITEDEVRTVRRTDTPIIWCKDETFPREVDTLGIFDEEAIELLWKYILCEEEDRPNVLAWLIATLTDSPTQIIMQMIGKNNSGKSSACDVLRDLTDPLTSGNIFHGYERQSLKGMNQADKYRAIRKNSVIFLDNLSSLSPEFQDVLCTIATGIRVDLRILFSGSMETLTLKRPVMITALADIITKPDLLSRSTTVTFSETAGVTTSKLSNEELFENWKADKPHILRALALMCQKVLARRSEISGRRGLYNLVLKIYLGEEAGERRAKEQFDNAQGEAIFNSSFCRLFALFVQERLEDMTGGFSSLELLSEYTDWLEENWGSNKVLRLTNGDYTKVRVVKDRKAIPDTPRGMSALINKFGNEFPLCGFKVSQLRKRNGRRERTIDRV